MEAVVTQLQQESLFKTAAALQSEYQNLAAAGQKENQQPLSENQMNQIVRQAIKQHDRAEKKPQVPHPYAPPIGNQQFSFNKVSRSAFDIYRKRPRVLWRS